jgi:hypothetical protein
VTRDEIFKAVRGYIDTLERDGMIPSLVVLGAREPGQLGIRTGDVAILSDGQLLAVVDKFDLKVDSAHQLPEVTIKTLGRGVTTVGGD